MHKDHHEILQPVSKQGPKQGPSSHVVLDFDSWISKLKLLSRVMASLTHKQIAQTKQPRSYPCLLMCSYIDSQPVALRNTYSIFQDIVFLDSHLLYKYNLCTCELLLLCWCKISYYFCLT